MLMLMYYMFVPGQEIMATAVVVPQRGCNALSENVCARWSQQLWSTAFCVVSLYNNVRLATVGQELHD